MSFDLALFGSKLRKYREQFDNSLDEISSATGLSAEDLESLENGKRKPTGDEILIIADYYKCDYQFFISNEQLAPFEQTQELFRKHGNEITKDDRWAIQEFLFLCECEQFLFDEILPQKQLKCFEFEKMGTFYKKHGEDAARELRKHLGYSINKVGHDIYEDFRSLGVHIFRRQLHNSKISGLYIKHPTAGKCVLVNYSEDVYRQRFTVAHETAHSILDHEEDFIVSFKWDTENLIEVRANTFASHYLMPPEFLQRIPDARIWDVKKAIDWANRLKVSTEALAYALKNAQLISEEIVEEIKSERVPPNMKSDPELPDDLSSQSRQRIEQCLRKGLSRFYVGLCFDAYESSIISAGRLAEMLLICESELKEMANLYNRSIYYGD